MKTLFDARDLGNPLFEETCMRTLKDAHGVVWSKKVFEFAGFRDTMFHKVIEVEDLLLSAKLSDTNKRRLIHIVRNIAKECSVDNGPYKWKHEKYGDGALANRGEVVGKCLVVSIKGQKEHYVVEGGADLLVDPSDARNFILTFGKDSAPIERRKIAGFWSNWKVSPLEPTGKAEEVFSKFLK